jgi:hypothetical protein
MRGLRPFSVRRAPQLQATHRPSVTNTTFRTLKHDGTFELELTTMQSISPHILTPSQGYALHPFPYLCKMTRSQVSGSLYFTGLQWLGWWVWVEGICNFVRFWGGAHETPGTHQGHESIQRAQAKAHHTTTQLNRRWLQASLSLSRISHVKNGNF